MIFTNVIKPTHICNLACSYCYNDDVRDPIMRRSTLERTIGQTFDYVRRYHRGRTVSFIWHGGEPLVAGREFFEAAVELQRDLAEGVPCHNSIQTNGTLIDEKWIELFRREDFAVSISVDGPAHLHDRYRVDHAGKGSHHRVMRAIESVQDAGIPLGVCVVISRSNIDHIDELYEFLTSRGLRFNIIPLNRSGAARDAYAEVGLEAAEYADAWIRMYDRWFDADEEYTYCSDFVFKTRAILAGRPADCIGLSNCSDSNISVDPVGDVYPCATLSGSTRSRYGNLVEQDLDEIMAGIVATSYRSRPVDPQCAKCKWQHVCHGGCLARAEKFYGDPSQRDYYCPSLFRIYEHIANRVAEHFGEPAGVVAEPPAVPPAALVQSQFVQIQLRRAT